MLVTPLAPAIGYDKAAQIARTAHTERTTLRQAALKLGFVSADGFDRWVRNRTDYARRFDYPGLAAGFAENSRLGRRATRKGVNHYVSYLFLPGPPRPGAQQ